MGKTTEFLDLEVQVARNMSGAFETQILISPRDRPRSFFDSPYSVNESAELLESLERLLERHHDPEKGPLKIEDLSGVEATGRKLFEALFPAGLRATLDASLSRRSPLRLRLSLDPEDEGLAHVGALPWEILFHPEKSFLARRHDVALVRYLDVPVDIERLFVPSTLRVLVVAPAPTDCEPIELAKEQRSIERILASIPSVEVERVDPPTVEHLLECLRDQETHVIHYLGHGGYDKKTGAGGLFFERDDRKKDIVLGRHFARRLEPFFDTLRLVVLNTCLGTAGRRRPEHQAFGSVSSTLIAGGLPAVLGMQLSIPNRAAERFAESFYGRLVETGHVEDAAAEARRELYRSDRLSPEWMIPVVVTRAANGRLFDPRAAPQDGPLRVGVRSFSGWGVEIEDGSDAFLPLTSFFRGRRPLEDVRWRDLYGHLETFLRKAIQGRAAIHFDFAAHLSLAFAAGYLIEAKAGIDVTVRQRSMNGTRDWSLKDLAVPGAASWVLEEHPLDGGGDDIALAVSCSRSILSSVTGYVEKSQPDVGTILELQLPEGAGQLAVLNGWHAYQLAEAINRLMHERVPGDWSGTYHFFYSGPNGLLCFLGRLSHGPRKIQLYEYDFDAEDGGTYSPSLRFPPVEEA